MARWLDPITSAVEEVVRERDAARAQAITNWAEVQRLREEVERLRRDLDTANYIIGLNIKRRATLASVDRAQEGEG